MKMTDASLMTDVALVAALGRLAGSEREATVALIVHLAEFESRRLYEAAGFRTVSPERIRRERTRPQGRGRAGEPGARGESV